MIQLKQKCKAKGDEISPDKGVFRCQKPLGTCDQQTDFAGQPFHVEPNIKPKERIIEALEHKEIVNKPKKK